MVEEEGNILELVKELVVVAIGIYPTEKGVVEESPLPAPPVFWSVEHIAVPVAEIDDTLSVPPQVIPAILRVNVRSADKSPPPVSPNPAEIKREEETAVIPSENTPVTLL